MNIVLTINYNASSLFEEETTPKTIRFCIQLINFAAVAISILHSCDSKYLGDLPVFPNCHKNRMYLYNDHTK